MAPWGPWAVDVSPINVEKRETAIGRQIALGEQLKGTIASLYLIVRYTPSNQPPPKCITPVKPLHLLPGPQFIPPLLTKNLPDPRSSLTLCDIRER